MANTTRRLSEYRSALNRLHQDAGAPTAAAVVAGIALPDTGKEVSRWLLMRGTGVHVSGSLAKALSDIKKGVRVSESTLRGWWGPKRRVSGSDAQLLLVIGVLRLRASANGHLADPSMSLEDLERWVELRHDAWAEKRSTTEPAASDGDGSAVAGSVGVDVRSLAEGDIFDLLNVHRVVRSSLVDGENRPSVQVLPAYLTRDFDSVLRARIREAAELGVGRIIVLTGDSATGKSRAAWEAVKAELPTWRVWCNLFPGHCADEVAAAVAEGDTENVVLWLSDAQNFFETREGPALAHAIGQLLSMPGGRLVLVTMWPEAFRRLTDKRATRHAAVGGLLRGHSISLPTRFEDRDLERGDNAAAVASDAVLRTAIGEAESGRVVQRLAGVPELERRFASADVVENAVLATVVDAHRLCSSWRVVSADFIHDAAPGYLADAEWKRCQPWSDHLGAAIDRLESDAHGIDGLLKHHVPRPGLPGEAGYEITDVLEQRALRARAVKFPPAVWWDAAAKNQRGNAARLTDLGRAALDRGRRVRGLDQFYGQAALDGDDSALYMLVRNLSHDRRWSSAWRWVERATAVATPGRRWAMLSLVFERDNNPQGAADAALIARDHGVDPADFESENDPWAAYWALKGGRPVDEEVHSGPPPAWLAREYDESVVRERESLQEEVAELLEQDDWVSALAAARRLAVLGDLEGFADVVEHLATEARWGDVLVLASEAAVAGDEGQCFGVVAERTAHQGLWHAAECLAELAAGYGDEGRAYLAVAAAFAHVGRRDEAERMCRVALDCGAEPIRQTLFSGVSGERAYLRELQPAYGDIAAAAVDV